MRQPTPLERRAAAVAALMAEFQNRAFSWSDQVTCVRMVAAHLRRMGWTPPIARIGQYKTARGAMAALKRSGFASLADGLDHMGLLRIAPAAAIIGDIVELPGVAPFGALTVAVGNGRVLGFHEDLIGADVLQPVEFVTAWRVDPQ